MTAEAIAKPQRGSSEARAKITFDKYVDIDTMSIERLHLIDSIVIDQSFGICTLGIVDSLSWDEEHLADLQERINNSLQFIESGEIYVACPGSRGLDFAIHVQFIHAPNEVARRFLAEAQNVLEDAGYELIYGPLGSDYASDAAE